MTEVCGARVAPQRPASPSLAVELRLERARTTKDVDRRVVGSPDDILDRLRSTVSRDLGDFMVFTIRPDDRHPEIQNDGMQYVYLTDLWDAETVLRACVGPS